MGAIFSLKDKQREKQINYERRMLKEISLLEIRKTIEYCFDPFFRENLIHQRTVEDGCVDFAIEAFLLGAKYGRFGFYGENIQMVSHRSEREEKIIINDFIHYLLQWGRVRDHLLIADSLTIACESFIHHWWKQGFYKGEKRYKLRLQ